MIRNVVQEVLANMKNGQSAVAPVLNRQNPAPPISRSIERTNPNAPKAPKTNASKYQMIFMRYSFAIVAMTTPFQNLAHPPRQNH